MPMASRICAKELMHALNNHEWQLPPKAFSDEAENPRGNCSALMALTFASAISIGGLSLTMSNNTKTTLQSTLLH